MWLSARWSSLRRYRGSSRRGGRGRAWSESPPRCASRAAARAGRSAAAAGRSGSALRRRRRAGRRRWCRRACRGPRPRGSSCRRRRRRGRRGRPGSGPRPRPAGRSARAAPGRLDELALGLGAGQDDRVHLVVAAEPVAGLSGRAGSTCGGRARRRAAGGRPRRPARCRPPSRSSALGIGLEVVAGSTPPSARDRGRACRGRRRSGAAARAGPSRGTSPAWRAGSRSGAG